MPQEKPTRFRYAGFSLTFVKTELSVMMPKADAISGHTEESREAAPKRDRLTRSGPGSSGPYGLPATTTLVAGN